MYAVIRTGGKQYRVAPGDVIRVENTGEGADSTVEFNDVVAVSAVEGQVAKPGNATVTGRVVEDGRGAKILVFHYKRKKQYKKLRGHRQGYTAVRITEIAVDGQKFSAPKLAETGPSKRSLKAAKAAADASAAVKTTGKSAPKKKAVAKKKTAAKKAAPKKKK